MRDIAIIKPLSHLEGIVGLLLTKGTVFLWEESTKEQGKELLLTHNIDTIVCNPNQQTYKIDKDLLRDTQVKIINSCSTGLNHIDLKYCKKITWIKQIMNSKIVYASIRDSRPFLVNQLRFSVDRLFGIYDLAHHLFYQPLHLFRC